MNDITIDLANDLALIIPTGEGNPVPVNFTRMDITKPGCLIFYQGKQKQGFAGEDDNPVIEENFIAMIPWSSINIISFQNLNE